MTDKPEVEAKDKLPEWNTYLHDSCSVEIARKVWAFMGNKAESFDQLNPDGHTYRELSRWANFIYDRELALQSRVKELGAEINRLQEDCPQTWKAVADAHWDKVESLQSQLSEMRGALKRSIQILRREISFISISRRSAIEAEIFPLEEALASRVGEDKNSD